MTTVLSIKAINPHISALESVFTQAAQPIEWLVIAHNDSGMLRSLAAGLNGESAAILEVSQDTWDFSGSRLPEAIEWALQQGEIKNVLLVGNSQSGGSATRASLVEPAGTNGSDGTYAKLLAGVQHHNARNRAAQERFAAHFQQMSLMPVLHDRWTNGELAVTGLFYRADGGLFLAYDADADAFRPLVAG